MIIITNAFKHQAAAPFRRIITRPPNGHNWIEAKAGSGRSMPKAKGQTQQISLMASIILELTELVNTLQATQIPKTQPRVRTRQSQTPVQRPKYLYQRWFGSNYERTVKLLPVKDNKTVTRYLARLWREMPEKAKDKWVTENV